MEQWLPAVATWVVSDMCWLMTIVCPSVVHKWSLSLVPVFIAFVHPATSKWDACWVVKHPRLRQLPIRDSSRAVVEHETMRPSSVELPFSSSLWLHVLIALVLSVYLSTWPSWYIPLLWCNDDIIRDTFHSNYCRVSPVANCQASIEHYRGTGFLLWKSTVSHYPPCFDLGHMQNVASLVELLVLRFLACIQVGAGN